MLYMIWLLIRHPQRIADVARVHLDEEPGADVPAQHVPTDVVEPA